MPKRIQKFFLIMTALVSLVFIFSCSTGDKTGVERTSITDVISGDNNPVGPSIPDTFGGGGGGGTGACVIADFNVCYQGVTQSICDFYAGYYTSTFTAGGSCGGSYPYCTALGGGISVCDTTP